MLIGVDRKNLELIAKSDINILSPIAKKRLGIKEKSAPSVKRLFGTLKDVKKVTFTEKNLLYKRIS